MDRLKKISLKKLLDPEIEDLCSLFSEEELTQISSRVCDDYAADKSSMSKWVERAQYLLKINDCDPSIRSILWDGASNTVMPIISNACLNNASRMYVELLRQKYPASTYVVGQEVNPEIRQSAQLLREHLLYQLRINRDCTWSTDLFTTCMLFEVVGTVPRYKYYDSKKKAYCFRALWPGEWCVPDESDDFNNTRFTLIDKNVRVIDILDGINSGEYRDGLKFIATILETSSASRDYLYQKREVIRQFVRLDLDQDGYAEPYTIVVDLESREILSWRRGFYYESQQTANPQTGEVKIESDQIEYDSAGMPVKVKHLPEIPHISFYKKYPGSSPSFLRQGTANRLAPLNTAMSGLVNQTLDVGTLNARQGAFIDSRARLPGGTQSLKMNESMFVKPPPGMTIAQAISSFPRSEVSPIQVEMIRFLKEESKETSSVTDILNGQVPDNVGPEVALGAVQNSLLTFKSGFALFLDGYNREITTLGILNYLYLDDLDEFQIGASAKQISKELYNPKYSRIIPVADSIISSDSERHFQQLVLNEMLGRPEVNDREILLRRCEVANIEDAKRYLPDPDPNPPPDPQIEQIKATIEAMKQQINQGWANAELNKNKLKLEAAKALHEMSERDRKLALDADIAEAEMTRQAAASIKDLALAEAAEAGAQLAEYQANLEKVDHDTERYDRETEANRQTVTNAIEDARLVTTPNDPRVPQVP